jgi:hypothetical protein
MNCSLYSLDRTTHLKIVVIAVIAAALVVCIGKNSMLGALAPALPIAEPHWVAPKADREHPQAPVLRPRGLRTEIA